MTSRPRSRGWPTGAESRQPFCWWWWCRRDANHALCTQWLPRILRCMDRFLQKRRRLHSHPLRRHQAFPLLIVRRRGCLRGATMRRPMQDYLLHPVRCGCARLRRLLDLHVQPRHVFAKLLLLQDEVSFLVGLELLPLLGPQLLFCCEPPEASIRLSRRSQLLLYCLGQSRRTWPLLGPRAPRMLPSTMGGLLAQLDLVVPRLLVALSTWRNSPRATPILLSGVFPLLCVLLTLPTHTNLVDWPRVVLL